MPRPLPLMALLVVAVVVVGCGDAATPPISTQTLAPASTATGSSGPTGSAAPGVTPAATEAASSEPPPSATPDASPSTGEATPEPSSGPPTCSGSDANRAFFAQAAIAMTWSVYCAVTPAGWFLENGSYRLADGGRLEATYRGPGEARIAMVQGNVCESSGADVDVCAPRDTLIGPAALGDRTGELGRLANGLVLDADRGANPSWRITGLGISESEFVALGAAMLRVIAGG